MPTLALQRLYLLPPSQWPVPKLRHRLSQLNVRSGIITDPLCLWSRTAHPAKFYYQKPRPGMLDAGARPGSLLFRGRVNGGQYSGTAYFFNSHCGAIPFEVKGPSLGDEERIVLTGQAPRVGRDCRTYGSYQSNLEFRRSRSDEANQPLEPKPATPPSAIEASRTEIKPDASPTNSGEVPRAPIGQRATRIETPSTPSSASFVDPQRDPTIPQPGHRFQMKLQEQKTSTNTYGEQRFL
jgi:hypothetical protein